MQRFLNHTQKHKETQSQLRDLFFSETQNRYPAKTGAFDLTLWFFKPCGLKN